MGTSVPSPEQTLTLRVVIGDLIVAVAVYATDTTRVAHREPIAPRAVWLTRAIERGAAAIAAVARRPRQLHRRRLSTREHDRTQCDPRTERRMDEELAFRERAEARGDRDALKRDEAAVV